MLVVGGDRRRRRRGLPVTTVFRVRVRDVLILARGCGRRWVRRRVAEPAADLVVPGEWPAAARTPPSCTGSSARWVMPALPRRPGWRRAPGSATAAPGGRQEPGSATLAVVLDGRPTTLKLVFRLRLQKFQHHKLTYVDKDRW